MVYTRASQTLRRIELVQMKILIHQVWKLAFLTSSQVRTTLGAWRVYITMSGMHKGYGKCREKGSHLSSNLLKRICQVA